MFDKPLVLYHGSPYRFDEAIPSFCTATTDPACRRAVYATDDRRIGLVFALKCRRDRAGSFRRPRWWRKQNAVFVAAADDAIDWGATGFLYHFPSAGFHSENGWEWVSATNVAPIRREPVDVSRALTFVSRLTHETVYEVSEPACDRAIVSPLDRSPQPSLPRVQPL